MTPQLEDIFQSVLNEIHNRRALSCVIGFPKSGKTSFLERLESALELPILFITASSGQKLSQALNDLPNPEEPGKPLLTRLLREKNRVLLLIDNAHLLTDGDFTFLSGLFTLAEHQQNLLQVVMVGNGEIVHKLARPNNRAIYNLLGAIWNLPKLTREQSLEYVRFLLGNAGLASDLITSPEALVRRAAGVIGILRMLTITLALKALNDEESCDACEILEHKSPAAEPASEAEEEMPVQKMASSFSPTAAILLTLSMAGILALFLFFMSWLMPGTGLKDIIGIFRGTPQEEAQVIVPEQPAPAVASAPTAGMQRQSVAKTVFRKRTKDGPYSVQLGSYQTMEALLLHLPRFEELDTTLFWNKDRGETPKFTLFAGRFESFEEAGDFATGNELQDTTVVFRPFVSTVGPLTNSEQVKRASMLIGLKDPQKVFEHELVTGVEVQFALERSREDALAHCEEAEKLGLSCAVTQYE